MASYWCAFRLAADKAYRRRYEALLARIFALRGNTDATWSEASYFLAFQADLALDEAARRLAETLDPKRDMLVVGVIGTADVIWFGQLQHPAPFARLFPAATHLADFTKR